MRVLFFVLLIANLALFAIGQFSSPNSATQTREELFPEKLQILPPEEK